MRIQGDYLKDGVATPYWVELRDAGALSGADEDAFKSVYDSVLGGLAVDLDEDMEVSHDGVSMTRKPRQVKVSLGMVNQQRDVLLSRLITDWSFTDIPLPYTALSRERLPLPVCKALDAATTEHKQVLNASGPDPKGATTSASSNGSRGVSQPRRKG